MGHLGDDDRPQLLGREGDVLVHRERTRRVVGVARRLELVALVRDEREHTEEVGQVAGRVVHVELVRAAQLRAQRRDLLLVRCDEDELLLVRAADGLADDPILALVARLEVRDWHRPRGGAERDDDLGVAQGALALAAALDMARRGRAQLARVVLPVQPRPEGAERVRLVGEVLDERGELRLQDGALLHRVRPDDVLQEGGQHRAERVVLRALRLALEVGEVVHELDELLGEEALDVLLQDPLPRAAHRLAPLLDEVLDAEDRVRRVGTQDNALDGLRAVARGLPLEEGVELAVVEQLVAMPDLDEERQVEAVLQRPGNVELEEALLEHARRGALVAQPDELVHVLDHQIDHLLEHRLQAAVHLLLEPLKVHGHVAAVVAEDHRHEGEAERVALVARVDGADRLVDALHGLAHLAPAAVGHGAPLVEVLLDLGPSHDEVVDDAVDLQTEGRLLRALGECAELVDLRGQLTGHAVELRVEVALTFEDAGGLAHQSLREAAQLVFCILQAEVQLLAELRQVHRRHLLQLLDEALAVEGLEDAEEPVHVRELEGLDAAAQGADSLPLPLGKLPVEHEGRVQHRVDGAHRRVSCELLDLRLRPLRLAFLDQLVVRLEQLLLPQLARARLERPARGHLARRLQLAVVEGSLLLAVEEEHDVGVAACRALDGVALLEQLQRVLALVERLVEHHEDDARLLDAFARLRDAAGVHIVRAGQVDEAVSPLEHGRGLEVLDALDCVAVEHPLVIELLDEVVRHHAVQVDRLARAEVHPHRRADDLQHLRAHLDVLPLGLEGLELGQAAEAARLLARALLHALVQVPRL
mmetsp:Transcript_21621/g.36956  ORF Transcript_21621/g.36956 Transcript_21621/m.36956 type:complete len:818 (+) Transcript_21621:905-3358(+)